MAIITFWTEVRKEIGQTAATIAIATQMAMEHNCKILLLTTSNAGEVKNAFWKREEEEKRKGLFSALKNGRNINNNIGIRNGMDGVLIAMQSNRLTPEQITDYTKMVFKNRLEVLEGSHTKEKEYREGVFKYYPELIRKASLYYDYVFVDLNKEQNAVVNEILDMSTIIAYGINQRNSNINIYEQSRGNGFLSDKNNIIPYLGRYDRFSKYSVKNVSRELKVKDMGVIPYNTLFAESCDEGVVAEYFMKMSTVTGPDRNVDFINYLKKFTENIIHKEQELKMNYRGN